MEVGVSSVSRLEYQPSSHISWRVVAGELVVLDMISGEYHTFNDVGRAVWLSFANGNGIDVTKALILEEFDGDETTIDADVDSMVANLLERGLLGETSSANPTSV
jgi:hypothetical protein